MDTVNGLVAGGLMFDFYSRTDDQLSVGTIACGLRSQNMKRMARVTSRESTLLSYATGLRLRSGTNYLQSLELPSAARSFDK